MNIVSKLIFLCLACLCCSSLRAQEENSQVAAQGSRYVDLKIKALHKYDSRIERQQKHLLNNLKKKEDRFARKLKKNDSAAYARYAQQSLSYDSISRIAPGDSSMNTADALKKKNAAVDSLKKIQSFVEKNSGLPAGVPQASGKTAELNKLQGDLNYRNSISTLISKRTDFLKHLAAPGEHLPGFTGIEKQVFYGKAKMKAFKEMEEDPTVAEDKALEYLQGTEGFAAHMSNAGSAVPGMGGTDAGQLEKMGFQTKQMMQKNLTEKMGGNLGAVGKQMNGSLKQWQEQQKKLSTLKEAKQSLKGIKNTEKPSFKINPMRGLPFCKRIEKQYNFQTMRAQNGTPAQLELSAMAGFKHTPKLTYGAGLATSFGLGQSWQNIHLSWQGIGYRTFARWDWQYGIGAYAGYERMYKQAAFIKPPQLVTADRAPTIHNNNNYTETILIGLTKSYHMNAKYNGAIQVLYDLWWQQKGLASPIVLRFVTVKK